MGRWPKLEPRSSHPSVYQERVYPDGGFEKMRGSNFLFKEHILAFGLGLEKNTRFTVQIASTTFVRTRHVARHNIHL